MDTRYSLTFALLLAACGPSLATVQPGTDTHRWFDDPQLQATLDSVTRSRVTYGNSASLLINGVNSFARRHQNLESARFVLVKTFIWTDDEAGRRLANAIAERARAGVPVMIQYDVKGNVGSLADAEDMLSRRNLERPLGEPTVIAVLRAAGAYVVETNSPGRPVALREWVENTQRFFKNPIAAIERSMESLVLFDHCDHDKYFVTVHDDGDVRAIVGGLNIASEYAYGGVANRVDAKSGRGGWRDTDLELTGPVAHAIVDEFLADSKRHRGKAAPSHLRKKLRTLAGESQRTRGNLPIRFVVNNPLTDNTRHIDDLLRILVMATPKNEPIFFSTPYFAPSKRLRDAMHEHMKSGGTITLLTNSFESSDVDILTDAARYTARELMKSGRLVLLERLPRPDLGEKMLHHKIASFGHHGPMVIGSANLDAQSFVHNGEAVVVVQDAALRRDFDAMVRADSAPDRVTNLARAKLEDAAVTARLRQFATGELAWYWL